MIRSVVAVAALALTSCERSEPTPRRESCLVDELGPLHPEWANHPACTPNNLDCAEACRQGDGNFCLSRAFVLEQVADDSAEVEDLFERACRAGFALGCTNWGAVMWAHPRAHTSQACVDRMFERTCAANEAFGCGMVGRMLLEPPTSPLRIVEGFFGLERGCEQIGGPSCRFLAYYIELGRFGAPPPGLVKQLLARACATRDEVACGHERARDTMNSE